VSIGPRSEVDADVWIGGGAEIAAASVVHSDVPARGRWGGVPAQPLTEWFREVRALRRLARRKKDAR
jgi:UDP-3-O-[3-hydroxymyristoyl] glucosamine N-acyltransferase